MGESTPNNPTHRDTEDDRKVDEAHRESFPASDPPSFTPEGTGAKGEAAPESDDA